MEQQIREALLTHSTKLFGTAIDTKTIQFQRTHKHVEGDLTLLAFPFAKHMNCSVEEAGEKIGDFLVQSIENISHYTLIGGFINLLVADNYWINRLKQIATDDNYGLQEVNSKPLIMVEYASPNTNKPLHLGHLRNIFLGDSVAKILQAYGHQVVRTQIINDRGIHICKSMLAWLKFSPINEQGERQTPANTNIKGDKLVGNYYVEFDRHFQAQANLLVEQWENNEFTGLSNELKDQIIQLQKARQGKDTKTIKGINDKIKELAKPQTALLQEAQEMLLKWEANDPEIYALWQQMNAWVYEGLEDTYRQMKVEFDHLYYESDTFKSGKEIVQQGLKSGIFSRKQDGSVWIDLSSDGLDEKLVLRSDGTAVYMTQDIGTAIQRFSDYPQLNGIVYTVGNEQDYHFKVLFIILEKLGYTWAKNCFHLSYGMVDLPQGKMKSREGTVVDADDLMQEVIDKATLSTQSRGHIESLSEQEIKSLCHTIGLGGLKYFLLKIDPRKRMVFNPAESVELNGNTGPFIQYTYARIRTLLSKNTQTTSSKIELTKILDIEKDIIKCLHIFPSKIADAARDYSPALIANYLYELVKLYNQFYQSTPILKEPDLSVRSFRLLLSETTSRVIKRAMNLLGIDVPERM